MTEVYSGAFATYDVFRHTSDDIAKPAGAVMSAAIKAREKSEALERVLEAQIAKQHRAKQEAAKPQQPKAKAEGMY